jgi:histidinol-phosphate/aromatic aminotransferase/cobyric acid decarboxylase-like protein
MLGVGSDEPIDLTIRIFCEPERDNIVAIDPTYGMYQVCADINNVAYRKAPAIMLRAPIIHYPPKATQKCTAE